MSEPVPSETATTRVKRSAVLAVGAVGVAVVAATAILYSQRGPIGARLAVDYLQRRGVPALITIERLGPRGFVGSMRLGPAADADLTIDRIEVEFAPFPLVRDGLAPRVSSIRMVRPRLKGRYAGGKLTFGSLQRLVDEFLTRPVTGPAPDVLIEQGSARIATDVGELRLDGGGALVDGRIVRLDTRMGRHRLAKGSARLELDGASLQLRASNDRLIGRFDAVAPRIEQPGLAAEGATVTGVIDLPYAPGAQAFRGRTGLEATVAARSLSMGDSRLTRAKVTAALGGVSRGAFETLTLDGRGSVAIDAESLSGSTVASALKWSAASGRLHLARTPRGVSFEGPMQTDGSVQAIRAGGGQFRDVRLTGVSQAVSGNLDTTGVRMVSAPRLSMTARNGSLGGAEVSRVRVDLASPELTLASVGEGPRISGRFTTEAAFASVSAGGAALSNLALRGAGQAETEERELRIAWRGAARSGAGPNGPAARSLVASLAPVVPDRAALERFVRTLRLDAPDLRLESAGGAGVLTLGAPARLIGEGGAVVLTPVADTALAEFGAGGVRGAMVVSSEGPALPTVEIQAPAYRLSQDGLLANVRLTASRLNAGPLQGLRLGAAGQLTPERGRTAFVATECARLTADRLVGEDGTIATAITGQACGVAGQPLVSVGPNGWAAHAQLREAGARLPAAEVEAAKAAGVLDLTGAGAGLTSGSLRLTSMTIADRAAEPRFLSLDVSGAATVRGGTWLGDFVIADAQGARRLGAVTLTHDMRNGAGSAQIDAQDLIFAKNGLQPAQITPLAARVLRDAEGRASFTGQVGWSAAGLTSSGRVSSPGLNFRASMGQVTGLKGEVVLTSLAPLATASDQTLTIEHIDWLVPLDQAKLTLTLTPTDVRITTAQVGIGGGLAVLDPLDLKLGALLPMSGTLRLADIDLGKLVSQFNLADKVSINAKVDGLLPFAFTTEGLRFSNGRIFADGPGRISIKREALIGVTAQGAPAAAPANAMESFAYQAMENLAFSQMDARITSQPQGRLGVLFHINGRHDPPVARTARIGILDLLKGRAFEKDLPLPKGTPVDLTLDTSLNFDELMAAYSNAGRSTAVQP